MLRIETSGSWHDMGAQVGQKFAAELQTCMHHYTPWLFEQAPKYTGQIAGIARQIKEMAPDLHEETCGMAEGAGIALDLMTGYRFFSAVRYWPDPGCSVIYVADSDRGPLMARNCDLFPDFDPPMQLCQVYRPKDGIHFATCTYLGTPGLCGINAHGLVTGGASAHTAERYGTKGITNALFGTMMIRQGKNVNDVVKQMSAQHFLGKPCNDMVGDAHGSSAVFELAPGRLPVVLERTGGRDWQCCTNFYASGQTPILQEKEYLQSAFARFGRVCHVMDFLQPPHTFEGLRTLITEIAQPGMVTTGREGQGKTAFSQIMETRTGTMHFTPGHPSEVAWESVRL